MCKSPLYLKLYSLTLHLLLAELNFGENQANFIVIKQWVSIWKLSILVYSINPDNSENLNQVSLYSLKYSNTILSWSNNLYSALKWPDYSSSLSHLTGRPCASFPVGRLELAGAPGKQQLFQWYLLSKWVSDSWGKSLLKPLNFALN